MRGGWAVSVLATAATVGAVGCGAVLGLNDYGDRTDGASAGDDAGADVGGGSEGGSDASTGSPGDAAATDSGADVGQATYDADAGGDATSLGDGQAPARWTEVAFSATPQTTCPAGVSSTPQSVVFDTTAATAAANACTCDCSMTSAPSCVAGTITGTYDTNGMQNCGTPSPSLANANPGGCNTDNPHTALSNLDVLWNATPPSGGACSASSTPHADRVTFANQGTICPAPGDAGAVSGTFRACIMSPGNVPCPPGPFAVAQLVGTGALVSCSGACTCGVSATCGSGVVTYYRNSSCSGMGGATFVMPANGRCNQVGGTGSTYGSYTYSAALLTATCSTTGSPVATIAGLAGQETVCCGP